MKILVTGGAGFIGSHLVRALIERGDDVFVVDNLSSGKRDNVDPKAHFIEADILELDLHDQLPDQIDQIFHLAAQIDVRKSIEDPEFNNKVNIEGTQKVIDYGVKTGMQKLVFSSTGGAIYGPADQIPTSEHSPCKSSSPYGKSKFEAEKLILASAKEHEFESVILRYANVYGPGQGGSKETGVIAIFTASAHAARPSVIYGDGEQTRDFVYVQDVVQANLMASNDQVAGIVNVGTGIETTINQLAELLKKLVSPNLVFSHLPARKGEERRSCLDNTKLSEKGWKPQISLERGIAETLKSMR